MVFLSRPKRVIMSMHKFDEETVTKTKLTPKKPSMYKVLLHNDDYTTMEFVVYVLETVFHKSPAEATQVMLNVHNNGIGICGMYTYEIAETKVAAVHDLAQQHEYPLRSSMDEA